MKLILYLRPFLVASMFLYASSSLQADLRVDLNLAGRPDAVDPSYESWVVGTAESISRTFDGVTFTFRRVGSEGTSLTGGWWKAGMDEAYYAKMISDGVTVEEGDAGGKIELRISGLGTGPHTLATFHNTWSSPDNATFSAIHISVDGDRVISGLEPTNRVIDNADGATAFLGFDAVAGRDVVILFEADTSLAAVTRKNVNVNGFELDSGDVRRKASKPSPSDADLHADADNRSLVLSWTPGQGAVSHDLYFGNDADIVRHATREDDAFVANLASASLLKTGVDLGRPCFWRVDEVDASGRATIGDVWSFQPRQLAFPRAEGYGRFAIGGRGGRVITVTNLNDSGEGSLRWALEQSGPRTIVFNVGGLITLQSKIAIADERITIAGQTAPGKGICIRNYNFGLSGADDVIIRFLRVRPGNTENITLDGMGMQGSDHCIIDHCSISWSIDEAFSSRSARNITLQHTLISEALNEAGHKNYPAGTQHGYAASIGGLVGSFHHNLLAHCAGRNWSLAGGLDGANRHTGWLDIRNNVVYNWKNRATDGGAAKVNFVRNYYKPGDATTWLHMLNPERDNVAAFGPQEYYVEGNVLEGHVTADDTLGGVTEPEPYANFIVDEPFFEPHVVTQSAFGAYRRVLADVGCNLPVLDDHDTRVIEETRTGSWTFRGSKTGLSGLPDSQDDVGGWEDYPMVERPADWDEDGDGMPGWWERLHGLNPESATGDHSEANADPDGDGFTNLEDYLNWMAQPNFECPVGGSIDIDLSRYATVFNGRVARTLESAVGGTVSFVDSPTATFEPAATAGLGSFVLRITDGEEQPFEQRFNIRVLPTNTASLDISVNEGEMELLLTAEPQIEVRIEESEDLRQWMLVQALTMTTQIETLSLPAAHQVPTGSFAPSPARRTDARFSRSSACGNSSGFGLGR